MKRYTVTEYDDASKEVQAVYDDFMTTTGSTSIPLWVKTLGHSASLARAYWERAKGTLFGGSLPLALKEMVVFVVSAQNGARYCSACHAQSVLSLDKTLSLDDLKFISKSAIADQLPPYYKTVVAFAKKAACDPNSLRDEDFEELMDEGFSKEEICEIIAVIDLAVMFNMYTSTLNMDLDPEYCAIL